MPKMMGRYFYRREATPEQRIARVWEHQEIKQLIARRSLMIFNNERQRELEELWVQEPENRRTAQLGSNWGYYVGLDSIARYYEKAFPAEAKDYCYHMPNGTNIIHIAADGRTAFCLIYALSARAADVGEGVRGYGEYDRIWFDMKKEAGGWKIWHVMEGNDITLAAGIDIRGMAAMADTAAEHPVNPAQVLFGEPDFSMKVFDPKFGWYPFPRIPDAHDSYSLDMSCSMEACLKFLAGKKAEKDAEGLYNALGGAVT
ncbi:MAG: nuclear transport factor 2 family protein [Oscillospiraceae bacterium]